MQEYDFYEQLKKYGSTRDVHALIIGAMDGVSHDSIKEFVNNPTWYCTFVEPIDFYMEKLKVNFGDSDRFSYINKAISDKDGQEKWLMFDPEKVDDYRVNNGMAGLSTIYPPKNCLKGFEDSHEYEDVLIRKYIDCITVETLMKQVGTVNYLQIDTEGYDWIILEQFGPTPSWVEDYVGGYIDDIDFIKVEYSSLTEIELGKLYKFLDKHKFEYKTGIEDIFAIRTKVLNEQFPQ